MGNAGVAQLVEQRIRNAKVGSSNLFSGTKFLRKAVNGSAKSAEIHGLFLFWLCNVVQLRATTRTIYKPAYKPYR